jgi:Apea-like HEPN
MVREPVESEFLPDRWLFQFQDVKSHFGKFIGRWLEYVKKYEESLECYFGTIYHRLPHSIEHLCLTQAFEAYHGIKFESHKERCFEDKIQELAEANKSQLKGLVDDVSEFAKTVLENRNYYTHHNPKWKENGRVVSGAKLHRLDEKLRLLFQMCVLSDMGIPSDRFNRLRRQLATHIIEYT